jgi:glutathione synthase/RimK-type ligase-like ATP-grasp enzyme
MRIALATSADLPILTDDDCLLLEPLAKRGIQPEAATWSDPAYKWASCDMVVIRSCWDYHLRIAEFLHWVESLEALGVPLWNSPKIIRWNCDKSYLRELEAKGISVVPTLWFERGPMISLADELRRVGWHDAVVKPRISATAHRTRLIRTEQAEEAQDLFDELRAGPGVMVQKFMEPIVCEGEWSLMFFGGEFSHAVLKTPKAGDFRVQHDFGGHERSAQAPVPAMQAAEKAVRAAAATLYARVDGVMDGDEFRLMELELIEPALFLQESAGAAEKLAAAIAARSTQSFA